MTIFNLKREIEAALLITNWSPTDSDLREIARKIRKKNGSLTRGELEEIVSSVVGSFTHAVMEGLDNSDLITILMMATKIENK